LVDFVVHPGLDSHPQHDIWKRDYTGSGGLFGFVFKSSYTEEEIALFVNNLKKFGIGYSWGGFKSLITVGKYKREGKIKYDGRHLVRLNVGLEGVQDLIEDLKSGFSYLT